MRNHRKDVKRIDFAEIFMNYWCRGTPDVIINFVLSYIFAELPEEKEKKHLKKKEKNRKKTLKKLKKKCAYLNKMFYLTIG